MTTPHAGLFTRLRGRVTDARGDDRGIAMIMVIGSISVLTLLMTASLGYAMSTKPQARADQDWHAALAAAQAGIDDYVARLNGNDNYWNEVDCDNDAMRGPGNGSNTCGWDASTEPGWQSVAEDNAEAAEFHYEVDSSRKDEEGGVRLEVTGRSRGETRTLQVKVGRGGTTQFLYYTDFESLDPANPYSSGTHDYCGRRGTNLARYWWDQRKGKNCTEIQFVAGDVLDGQAHFNDSPWITGGANFRKGFQTADPRCIGATTANACTRDGAGSVTVGAGHKANYHGPLYLEDNSDEFANFPGCQYTGDTRIRFSSDGTMRVWSKGSVGTDVGAGCGSATNAGLGSAGGQVVNQPYNEVIYVRNKGGQHKCAPGEVVNSGTDVIPLADDISRDAQEFYCGNGNVYVEGTLKTRVTIAAQNNVIVTDDLLLAGVGAKATPTGPHMVGLVAANSVVVYHPVEERRTCRRTNRWGDCTEWNSPSFHNLTSNKDIHIHASIQTLQHSFWVQSFQHGAHRGDLVVRGSMAQRWRGAVGMSGSGGPGYLKDYSYDPRLKFNSPPYFPQYVNASWAATVTGEMPPSY